MIQFCTFVDVLTLDNKTTGTIEKDRWGSRDPPGLTRKPATCILYVCKHFRSPGPPMEEVNFPQCSGPPGIHLYIKIHTYIYIYMYVYTCVHMYTCIHVYIYIYICVQASFRPHINAERSTGAVTARGW